MSFKRLYQCNNLHTQDCSCRILFSGNRGHRWKRKVSILDEVNLDSAKLHGDWEASVSLQFVLYNLKLVKIQGVLGRLNELMFLKVLLKNGIILEKVLVNTSTKLSKKSRLNFRKQLLALPRASSGVEIVLL